LKILFWLLYTMTLFFAGWGAGDFAEEILGSVYYGLIFVALMGIMGFLLGKLYVSNFE